MVRQIWEEGTGQLSFTRCALTLPVLALSVAFIVATIRADYGSLQSIGIAFAALLVPKVTQSFAEKQATVDAQIESVPRGRDL